MCGIICLVHKFINVPMKLLYRFQVLIYLATPLLLVTDNVGPMHIYSLICTSETHTSVTCDRNNARKSIIEDLDINSNFWHKDFEYCVEMKIHDCL
jgi:hypothetical protein